MNEAVERWHVHVKGTVQGVGFRPYVYRLSQSIGIVGSVWNNNSSVEIEAEATRSALLQFISEIKDNAPPLSNVREIDIRQVDPQFDASFTILSSSASKRVFDFGVAPDSSHCDNCLSELFSPFDRRHNYPLINCTDCGPRFTVTRALPYDRPNTTMNPFKMCAKCSAEYADPNNRRFHAQPIGCWDCGPTINLLDSQFQSRSSGHEAIKTAAELILSGNIVLVKGIGGFHFAVDATSDIAVKQLRQTKYRDDKPLAVMVQDRAHAMRLCDVSDTEFKTLESPIRPIVLLRIFDNVEISPCVAPGLDELGLMFPPSPLHELLARELSRPIVLTSANITNNPISTSDEELRELMDTDSFALTHNREIWMRCDDSVVRHSHRIGHQVLRRSRGYVPNSVSIPFNFDQKVLAVGSQLKNTIALAQGGRIIGSQHIGDLENFTTYLTFRKTIDQFSQISNFSPTLVAHDLHPEYLSTKFAVELDIPTLEVQHHHAHIASCMVDNSYFDPVIGIAFDGHGFGPDGTLWGGEFLVADLQRYKRAGRLFSIGLPSGAISITEPWRMAAAWVFAAGGENGIARIDEGFEGCNLRQMAMLSESNTATRTTSIGRLFDAVAALVIRRHVCTYEGQAAMELETCARKCKHLHEPIPANAIDNILDPRELIQSIINDLISDVPKECIAAQFHISIAFASATIARQIANESGINVVALSGGVFQNALLTELTIRYLESLDLKVLAHKNIPCNDGGISFGQAAIGAIQPCTLPIS